VTFPNGAGMPGQQQQAPGRGGWVQMPVPTDAQIQAARQGQPQMSSAQYAPVNQQFQQPQQQQQQQYQPQPYNAGPTQFIHTQEPGMNTPAPNLAPQPQQPQQYQPVPPTQQQPYLAQQQAQPAYAQQPQQQMGQQQAGGLRFDAQGRVQPGAGVPQELVGRTLNDVFTVYNTLRQAYVETQLGPQNQQQQFQQQPQQQQPPQRQQPQQQQTQQQVPAQARASNFWADPEGTIDRLIDKRLQPVTQQAIQQQLTEARNQVASYIPDFVNYEAGVVARLRGQPAEVLSNPEAWRYAYMIEKGEQQLRSNPPRNGFQQVGAQQQQQQTWQPATAVGSFFTENPTAPVQDTVNAQGQVSPEELAIAAKFGRSPEQYLAAKMGRF
jgi:hypothetical protein